MMLADANGGGEMGVIPTPESTPSATPSVTPTATVSASPTPIVFDPIVSPDSGSNWWIWLLIIAGLIAGVIAFYVRGKK